MLLILLLLISTSVYTLISEIDKQSLNSLAELPLEKLLYVKRVLESTSGGSEDTDTDNDDDDSITIENEDSEDALPLKTRRRYNENSKPVKLDSSPIRRTEWEEDYHYKGSKKKDLSSILQTTITVLSFLAFGAYLLCMIITALKNYHMNTNTTTTTPATAAIITGKRRRRRKRNYINEDQVSFDELITTLHNLAEGYVKYHYSDN